MDKFASQFFSKIYFLGKIFSRKKTRKYNFLNFQYFPDRIEVLESLGSLVSTKMEVLSIKINASLSTMEFPLQRKKLNFWSPNHGKG